MTFTSRNANARAAMVELSDADLEVVSGGTLGLLLYKKVTILKSIFSIFDKGHAGYNNNDPKDNYDKNPYHTPGKKK